MARIVTAYVSTLAVFAAVDAIWLTNSADLLYRPLLGPILAPQFRLVPAILFYLLYIAGLIYFAVAPALAEQRWQIALTKGALFGFFAYATYDLTNQATLLLWSTKITVADMIWGSFVSGISSAGGALITSRLAKG